jgi:PmbA protein
VPKEPAGPAERSEPANLEDLCGAAVAAALDGEAVEAYAAESRRTSVRARGGAVESLTFAESRGAGVRLIADGRLGYAYAADPSPADMRDLVARARENAAFAEPDGYNALPEAGGDGRAEPIPALFRETAAAMPAERKVAVALDLERQAVSADPRVRKVEGVGFGDSVSRVAVASTTGMADEYRRTDAWCSVSSLAVEGAETQTGFAFRLGHELDDLELDACAAEAADRAARLLGATKPATARVAVVLDPHVAVSFLGVLAGALSAESVQKGRSLFAPLVGQAVGSDLVWLIDDGRLLEGPGAAPFDDEGVATGRTVLIDGGMLQGFLHNTYTARRQGEGVASTGNAGRGGYRTPPGVAPTNLYLEASDGIPPEEILGRAEGGVYVQEVSGVHSGASSITGEFSVGATGLRIAGGALGEPLREMTIASTLPEMLKAVTAVGNDRRFFGGAGSPTVLVGDMTVAGR